MKTPTGLLLLIDLEGRSMVLDPFGIKVYELGHGIRYGEYIIDRDRLSEARKTIPVLIKSRERWIIRLK